MAIRQCPGQDRRYWKPELAGEKAPLDRSLKAAAIARNLAREKEADVVVVTASLLHGQAAAGRGEKAEDLLLRADIDQEVREQVCTPLPLCPTHPTAPAAPGIKT